MRALRLAGLGKEGVDHGRCFGHGAQHVQALHVAAAFPDRIDRCFTEQARHHAVFHDAAAADALHGFVGVVRCALADPVFANGCDQAHQQVFLFVAAMVHGACHTHRQRQRGFVFQRQIGQHVLHQRLLIEYLAESRTN